jgi:hypothetical protein
MLSKTIDLARILDYTIYANQENPIKRKTEEDIAILGVLKLLFREYP